MKHKNIEKDFLILCLERLTRLKPTNIKYERVFKDILNKKGIGGCDFDLAKKIFNEEISLYTDKIGDGFINDVLKKEEKETFFQEGSLTLDDLNLEGVLDLIENYDEMPLNIKRLILLNKKRDIEPCKLRYDYSLLYPVQKIVLTEGITEEILLGPFAKKLDLDFKKEGIYVLGAGGKRQVAKKYYEMIENVKLPIFILLDNDADEIRKIIEPKLREIDFMYLIKSGEFEDIIPKKTVINSINSTFKNGLQINEDDFDESLTTVKNLKEIYRIKGFGDFQKADFAKSVKENLDFEKIEGEIVDIIDKIRKF